jgi:lysozyme
MKNSTKVAAGGLSAGALAMLITFVGAWEGRSLQAYRDIVGVPTICYGETRGVEMGDKATPAECDTMLAKGLAEFNAGLNRCLIVPVPDKVRVAFVSWAYNVGLGAACGSTLVKRANGGNLRAACDQLLVWTRAGGRVVQGLVNRRKAEHALCLEGIS